MRPLPLSLWLLVAAQIDAQAHLPTVIRKMSPDAGEKFYHEYSAFAEGDEAAAAIPARQNFAGRRDADTFLGFNSSLQLPYHPPFAQHVDTAQHQDRDWISQGAGDAEVPPYGWQLLRRAAAAGAARARLEARAWSCPSGTSSCVGIGFPNSCCQTGESCVQIEDTGLGPVGCCPSQSTCAGTISSCFAGNTACPSNVGGGCCISGFVCEGVGCTWYPHLTSIAF